MLYWVDTTPPPGVRSDTATEQRIKSRLCKHPDSLTLTLFNQSQRSTPGGNSFLYKNKYGYLFKLKAISWAQWHGDGAESAVLCSTTEREQPSLQFTWQKARVHRLTAWSGRELFMGLLIVLIQSESFFPEVTVWLFTHSDWTCVMIKRKSRSNHKTAPKYSQSPPVVQPHLQWVLGQMSTEQDSTVR